jgi:tRNA (guanine-N7-)-methyltransferase
VTLLDNSTRRPAQRLLNRTFEGTVFDLFGTRAPLEFEIGAGRGRFLLHRAAAHPQRNFLGIDYRWRFLREGVERAERRGLTNLLFFKAEAEDIVPHLIPEASIDALHVYFPDPWHKRKHHKRRLLNAGFLKVLHARLVPGGKLELATDNHDYYRAITSAIESLGHGLWSERIETRNQRIMDPEVQTHFEAKYARLGRDLYYLELTR